MAPTAHSLLASTPLSVLDLAPVVEGSTARQALENSLLLSRHVEALGFKRHWVAEHHNLPGVASSATAVLMAHLAAGTSRIRIGAGGVMLPNHAPLVIAEQFGTLEALHPHRIDLGIGRAPGTDPLTMRALRRTLRQDDELPPLLGELLGFFTGEFPEDHPFRVITAQPGRGYLPQIWLLGSSGYSAQVAGILGLPFAFAHHFAPENTEPALELYRSRFRPSKVLSEPHAMVGVNVICAPTSDEAQRIAAPSRLSYVRRLKGLGHGQLPSIDEALAYPFSDRELEHLFEREAHQAVGDPGEVRARLEQLLERTEADELMITTSTFDERDRLRSYALLAEMTRPATAASVIEARRGD